MAQYKIKKDYIYDVCSKSLAQLEEQKRNLKKSKKWYHWIFKTQSTNIEIYFYRSSDVAFCHDHLDACLVSHGEYAIMTEKELFKLNKLWMEFVYDKK